jgi:hypothetical protein
VNVHNFSDDSSNTVFMVSKPVIPIHDGLEVISFFEILTSQFDYASFIHQWAQVILSFPVRGASQFIAITS